MFQDIEAQLAAVEARVRAFASATDAKLARIRSEIETLDSLVLAALDQVVGLVTRARGTVTENTGRVRARLSKLQPPG